MNKQRQRLILMFSALTVSAVALAGGTYFSYAWFVTQRSVQASLSTITVSGESLAMEGVYSYSKNDNNNSPGYHFSEASYTSFETDFANTVEQGHLLSLASSPSYAFTYGIKVNNIGDGKLAVSFNMMGYETNASTKHVHKAETDVPLNIGNRSYTQGQGFDLLDVTRAYVYATTNPSDDGIASFLSSPFTGANDAATNLFSNGGSPYTALSVSTGVDWLNENPLIMNPHTSGYIFLTLYVSNDPSTFWVQTADEEGVKTWEHDSAGLSNPYEDLTLTFSPFLLVGNLV